MRLPKVNDREFREQQKRNFKERLAFVDFWAEYMLRTPNSVWSVQHSNFINAQYKNVPQLFAQQYLKLKGEKCSR